LRVTAARGPRIAHFPTFLVGSDPQSSARALVDLLVERLGNRPYSEHGD
jgi:hypothetical protein